ncbi:hypothetical protein DOTSEDRAFT_87332 [Dothistroma septosporum NZE10]|uniref:Glutamine amidotransferase domain-containing protein n=1 Tax=Dothistroma septosporum (strain NZE10 / CBS 128990) TaxID=675120 RepID=N1PVF5_DOTSN|nr:hypothetical protein DOTSEDRAFT_87332 [Dothistroma septosporum NZE10]
MRAPLRIAILECDEPRGETKKRYKTFGNLFRELLAQGSLRLRNDEAREPPELRITSYDVLNDMTYPTADSIDAVLLTGSRYDSFDSGTNGWIDILVAYVQTLLRETRVRVIGVCFGHQIIGRALGVMPERSFRGWEVSVTPVDLSSTGKMLFGAKPFAIHEMHRDGLPRCPTGVESIGSSPLCLVQGLYCRKRVFSLQGHPEFTGTIAEELLDLRRGTVLSDVAVEDGKRRVHERHDGVKVAAAFLKFLLEE